jgi:hypothetical protein
MYEVLVAWETLPLDDQPSHIRDFAEIWRSADKVVYSSALDTVSSARTQIERSFDPDLELVDERRFGNGFVYLRHDVKS